MKIRAIILSALILCGISAVIMYSRAAQPLQKSSVITQAINDKNTPMVIKNLILKMKEQMEGNMSGVKEECGVFGIYDLDGGNIAPSIYYGLTSLQHLSLIHI